jgi:hypothetical protein
MKRMLPVLIAVVLGAAPLAVIAQDTPVTVTVNGAPVSFDQPPVEQVGRIYVPLRGVFERLGASVVYANGAIEATRGSTQISLQVGSTTATVRGVTTTLDAAPFLIGARVLVPLRFVAQALGATVNYDGSSRTVAIIQANAAPNVVITPPPAPPAPPAPVPHPPMRLVRIDPAPNSQVPGLRPQIAGTFPHGVDPNTVRIRIDGRDVTGDSYVSAHGFSYDPSYDLPYGPHEVDVRAPGVGQRWMFTNSPVATPNFLRDLTPHNGDRAGNGFTVAGFTQPFAHVHIVISASADVFVGEVTSTTATADAGADPQGHFARFIAFAPAPIGGIAVVDVRIESRAPDGTLAVRTLHLRP